MRSERLEVVPVSPRVRSRAGEFAQQPLHDGFLCSAEELAQAFREHGIYPIFPATTIDPEAALLFHAWLSRSDQSCFGETFPWVPVGSVGPLLLLGHMKVGISAPPLPWGTFQPVCLRREDYERHLANVRLFLEGRDISPEDWNADFVGGVGRFPTTIVMPTDFENAARFLREYFLHRPDYLPLMESDVPFESWPVPYQTAVSFLLEQTPLAQPATLRFIDSSQRHLPDTLRRKISVVSELDQQLWCSAPVLPQREAEDRLYAELGAGWTIHWVLAAPENASSPPSNPVSGASSQAPFKIIIPSAGSRSSKSDVVEAEERLVVLQEKEWERFDPRHRDSAEPENLWKWAVYKSLIEGATDLHIEPGANLTRVRQRIDGLLEEILEVPSNVGEAMVYSLMTQVGLGGDKYRPVDGSFQVEISAKIASRNQSVRVRANAYPVRGVTQKIALRFLPRQGAVPALETLLPARSAHYVSRAISRPEGLVLVCGPTGSGKTTTIFSALSVLNRPDLNVTTLENPVEILLEGTNQAEVNVRRDVTWSALNRAFLRQDPDVGLIGEIRDEDTAKTILRAALTGHLVFGSLHTKSCATSVIRMTDLGADPNMLAESLILVVCQRLIRRICPKCKEDYELDSTDREIFERHSLPIPKCLTRPSERSAQCEYCRGRGYRGRAAAVEVLPNVPAVRNLIESKAVSQAYGDWMKSRSLPTVFENALELAAAGVTSKEEALTLQDAWEGGEWQHLY